MRLAWTGFPIAALLVGCGPWDENRTKDSGDEVSCRYSDFVPVTGAGVTVTNLVIDQSQVLAGFEPDAVYEGYGASACGSPETGEIEWIIASGGAPIAAIDAIVKTTGNQDFFAVDGSELSIEVFEVGTGQTVIFTNFDFVDGAWVVDSTSPVVSFNVNGNAVFNGHTLGLTLAAEAVAP